MDVWASQHLKAAVERRSEDSEDVRATSHKLNPGKAPQHSSLLNTLLGASD